MDTTQQEEEKKPQGEPQVELRKLYRPWLGRVDRYIIRTFLSTFIFSIILILSIAVVFDVNAKISDFLKPEVPFSKILFHYYLNFIPYYANMFSPLFVFISVIFFTSNLAANTEIVAMLASGMSFRRLLRPYMVAAGIIACSTASSSRQATGCVWRLKMHTSGQRQRSTHQTSRSLSRRMSICISRSMRARVK